MLSCEFLFLSFHSPISLTLVLFPPLQSLALASGPRIPLPLIFLLAARTGGNGVRWLYLNADSQSASCIIMRSDISIHTKLFLSLCALVLPSEAEYLRPLSLTMRFPHTSFFQSHFYPKHPHNTFFFFFFFPSFLSTLEYPVFHSAAQWAV